MMTINRFRAHHIEERSMHRKCSASRVTRLDVARCSNIADAQAIFGDDFAFDDLNFDEQNDDVDEDDRDDDDEEEEEEESEAGGEYEVQYDDDGNPIEEVTDESNETFRTTMCHLERRRQ
jgi:hypothetical protein